MIFVHMFTRFKSFILSIITLFQRALCCFSRRRKSFDDCEILTSVNVQSNNIARYRDENERDWNSWDVSPRTVSEHIEQYRQKLAQSKTEKTNEPSIDFFQDMAPNLVKQKKVFIDTNKNSAENFARLQAANISVIPRLQTAELEDWSDADNGDNEKIGWEEADEITTAMIREKRREARAQRQQRLQQQK